MFVILKCMRIQLCTLFELNKREERKQSKANNNKNKKNTKSTKTRLKSNPFAIARNFMHIKKPFVQALGLNDKRQRVWWKKKNEKKKRWNDTDCLHHLSVLFFSGYIWVFDPVAKRPVKYSFKIVNSIPWTLEWCSQYSIVRTKNKARAPAPRWNRMPKRNYRPAMGKRRYLSYFFNSGQCDSRTVVAVTSAICAPFQVYYFY